MPVSRYRKEKIEKLKDKAVTLYKEGLTMREVGKIVGKSHQWVGLVVKEKLGPQR